MKEMEEGQPSWDFWSSRAVTELAFSDFGLIHTVCLAYLSVLCPALKQWGLCPVDNFQ